MSNRRAGWSRVIRVLIGAAAVVLVLAIVWALLVPGADWLARHDVGPARVSLLPAARDAARGRLLTFGAGLIATGALVFTARNFTLSRRTFQLTEQGQVTDRFTKAIEQLGSGKLDVRIGGIYALERVARDSARDHPTVMEVLTAFIREHSREPWTPPDTGNPDQQRLTRPDIQAAVTVVGRRDAERDIQPLDLTGAGLAGAGLTRAHLARAHLARAHLAGATLVAADLTGAHLTHADLTHANFINANLYDAYLEFTDLASADLTLADLTRAHLNSAHLTRAHLSGAHLTYAHLNSADLTRANFMSADLEWAELRDADLTGADLTHANLTRADLYCADLTDATLTDANLAGANLYGVRWPEGVPVPEGWIVDSDSSRLKSADELSEVVVHYL